MDLNELVESEKDRLDVSYEWLARKAELSLLTVRNVPKVGFTDWTKLGTIRGFAKALNMKAWELLRELDKETD